MKTILALLLAAFFLNSFAQVAINADGTPPHLSAMLEVKSITKGLLIPRMTEAQMQAIASPAAGLIVYNTNAKAVFVYNGGSWTLTPSATALLLRDTDGDTRVEVEKNPDEDIIRFSLAGVERMRLRGYRLELPSGATSNLLIGIASGNYLTTGENNTAVGDSALKMNSTGMSNTAVGLGALQRNADGSQNAAFGVAALSMNTSGQYNAAFGNLALGSNISGTYNTAMGHSALIANTGHYNTALGSRTLSANTSGEGNIGIGSEALFGNETGNGNVAIGRAALYNITDRSRLIAIGDSALHYNGTGTTLPEHGTNNVAIGVRAL
jgi:trimeric autotransporter adhesin